VRFISSATEKRGCTKKRHNRNRARAEVVVCSQRQRSDISKNTCEPYVRFISKVYCLHARTGAYVSECTHTQCVGLYKGGGGWKRKEAECVCS